MPKIRIIPGKGTVGFPDDMPEEEIRQVIEETAASHSMNLPGPAAPEQVLQPLPEPEYRKRPAEFSQDNWKKSIGGYYGSILDFIKNPQAIGVNPDVVVAAAAGDKNAQKQLEAERGQRNNALRATGTDMVDFWRNPIDNFKRDPVRALSDLSLLFRGGAKLPGAAGKASATAAKVIDPATVLINTPAKAAGALLPDNFLYHSALQIPRNMRGRKSKGIVQQGMEDAALVHRGYDNPTVTRLQNLIEEAKARKEQMLAGKKNTPIDVPGAFREAVKTSKKQFRGLGSTNNEMAAVNKAAQDILADLQIPGKPKQIIRRGPIGPAQVIPAQPPTWKAFDVPAAEQVKAELYNLVERNPGAYAGQNSKLLDPLAQTRKNMAADVDRKLDALFPGLSDQNNLISRRVDLKTLHQGRGSALANQQVFPVIAPMSGGIIGEALGGKTGQYMGLAAKAWDRPLPKSATAIGIYKTKKALKKIPPATAAILRILGDAVDEEQ